MSECIAPRTLDRGTSRCSASRSGHFIPGGRGPSTYWIGTGLDDVEWRKIFPLPGLQLRLLGRPFRSRSLCRLSYSGLHRTVRFALGKQKREKTRIILLTPRIRHIYLKLCHKCYSPWETNIQVILFGDNELPTNKSGV